jgi:hypothetical protein
MNGRWRLALLALGVSLCLPAAVLPETRVYSVRVPGATRVETSVSHSAGWDVAVSFDARTCQVFCEYRRKTGGWSLFLPPVVQLRIYVNGASRPVTATIDPAGAALPRFTQTRAPLGDRACLGGRLAVTTAVFESTPIAASLPPRRAVRRAPAAGHFTTLPLRI